MQLSSADQSNMHNDHQLNRTGLLLEVLVFLSLILPSMVLSLFAFQHEKATFAFVAGAVMLRDIALVFLILFFIWRNDESRESIGLTLHNMWREIGLGIVLYVPFFFLAGLAEQLFKAIGLSVPSGPAPSFLVPKGIIDFILAFVLVVVVAVTEETMFRGYLIHRLSAVTRSTALALVLSAAIFSIGHGYEGSAGMATVGTMGLIFGLVYLWRKSLIAPITLHFLQDFIGIVLIPLLAYK